MNKNRWMFATAMIIFLGVTGCAVGQFVHSVKPTTGKPMGKTIVPLTPEMKASRDKVYRLDKAAASALDAGQYAEAESDARQSVSIQYGSGVGQELLASALDAQGKTQEALQAYKVIADTGNDSCSILLPYARLLLKTGHWADAVAAYDKQLPGLPDENLLTANSHFSPTKPDMRELTTAIHIAQGLTYGGDSWGGHSQDDKAIREFQQALTLEPNSALANLFYGRKLQRLNRRTEAKAFFQKAAENGNKDVKAAAEKALAER